MWPQFFLTQIKQNKLSHAYLFLLPPLSDRAKIFQSLKKELAISSEDLYFLEDNPIKISQIRELKHNLSLKPFKNPYKVAVILYGEGLTHEASNSLLKTLEEPPGKAAIFIFVSDKEALLPTIVSRCQLLRLQAIDFQNSLLEDVPEIEKIAQMHLADRFNLAEVLSKREDLSKIIMVWQLQLRDKMLKDRELSGNIENTYKLLLALKTNANKTLLLENFFIKIS